MTSLALAGLVAAAGSAYLDAKYFIAQDLQKLYRGYVGFKGIKAALSAYEHNCSPYDVIHRTIDLYDDKEALVFEDRRWTFKEVRIEVERLEAELLRLGVCNRMYIAIFINNSPEFFFLFWALIKIGAIPATINTSLTRDRLLFCVDLPKPKLVFTSYELCETLEEALKGSQYEKTLICYDHDTYASYVPRRYGRLILHWNLKSAIHNGKQWDRPRVNRKDAGMLLYTSGTTGLPKASIIPAFFMMLCTFPNPVVTPEDRIYIPLPLFHGTAMLIGMVVSFGTQSTIILSRKFSKTTFWPEIRDSRATIVIYIGEMIRYLCQAPPHPLDSTHNVRLFWGLGLQSTENWLSLRTRFGVPDILEYYGSTEGTSTQSNYNTNSFGMTRCGHRGPLLRRLDKRFILVKHDLSTGLPYRNPDGRCEEVKLNEPGEALTMIDDAITAHNYLNNSRASTEKIMRDVLVRGDAYVRIGDLLKYDEDGFIQFLDRLGDTYRVKGHNISTTEVEECINRVPGIEACSVYSVNGQGMVAVVLSGSEALVPELERKLIEMGLPKYAVPKYLRIIPELQTTATHKIAKAELKKEGLFGKCFIVQREGEGYIPILTSKTS